MSHITLLILASLLMLPGLLGVLLPALPGIPFMLIVAIGFGFIDKFTHLSGLELTILGLIATASLAVDYFAGTLGAKLSGASSKATMAGLIGLILGIILFPPFGGFIGMFIGVLLVELKTGNQQKALKAATGSLVGTLSGMAINFLIALVFITLFIIFALA